MKQLIYLDNSATTKPSPGVVKAMIECLTNIYGNPSSVHRLGVEAEKAVNTAREQVARILKAGTKEIIFTSGGTEANNLAIKGAAYSYANRGKHIITTQIEHPAVLKVCGQLELEGFEVTYLPVNNEGVLLPEDLHRALREDTILISTMYVNNETGSIQPLEELSSIIKTVRNNNKLPIWHVDAVQALGKLPLNPEKLGVNLMSLSAHKAHGPKGIGALYLSAGTRLKIQIDGGGQEFGLRGGTENVPAIAGFGVAVAELEDSLNKNNEQMAEMKKMLVEGILDSIPRCRLNGPMPGSKYSAPHIANISFIGLRGEVLLHALEGEGIFVSTGSACSSRKKSDNGVLRAMGLSDVEQEGAIRFSFCAHNTPEQVGVVIDKLKEIVKELRSFG